jgi:hypothetical protein
VVQLHGWVQQVKPEQGGVHVLKMFYLEYANIQKKGMSTNQTLITSACIDTAFQSLHVPYR